MESVDAPKPQDQYQVAMNGDLIIVPISDRPDFDSRQFWIDLATQLNGGLASDFRKKQYGEMYDAYFDPAKRKEEMRAGDGLYAIFVREQTKDGKEIKQIAVQNRNGRGTQKYRDAMKDAVDTVLAPKPPTSST